MVGISDEPQDHSGKRGMAPFIYPYLLVKGTQKNHLSRSSFSLCIQRDTLDVGEKWGRLGGEREACTSTPAGTISTVKYHSVLIMLSPTRVQFISKPT